LSSAPALRLDRAHLNKSSSLAIFKDVKDADVLAAAMEAVPGLCCVAKGRTVNPVAACKSTLASSRMESLVLKIIIVGSFFQVGFLLLTQINVAVFILSVGAAVKVLECNYG
jgi:hypothetical protein